MFIYVTNFLDFVNIETVLIIKIIPNNFCILKRIKMISREKIWFTQTACITVLFWISLVSLSRYENDDYKNMYF